MADSGHYSRNGFLTRLGLAEAAQRERQLYGVDDMESFPYIDKVGSVSGLRRDEDYHVLDDQLLDQQYRRFHNGS